MSLRVAVACEDHTHDQYVVRPVVETLLSAAGFPRAQVRVITDPRINGIEDLKANAGAIAERYRPIFAPAARRGRTPEAACQSTVPQARRDVTEQLDRPSLLILI